MTKQAPTVDARYVKYGFDTWTFTVKLLLERSSDPSIAEAQARVMNALGTLAAEVETLSKQIETQQVKSLEEQHQQLCREARQAKDARAQAAMQLNGIADMRRTAAFKVSEAVSQRRALIEEEPHPDSYPTPDELARWQDKLEKAEQTVEAAHVSRQGVEETFAQLNRNYERLAEAFNVAAGRELELRRRISPASSDTGGFRNTELGMS